jgi:hypothetical protein
MLWKQCGHVACIEDLRIAYKMLAGTPAGNSPLGRPWCKYEDNIKMDPKETGLITGGYEISNKNLGSIKWGNVVTSCPHNKTITCLS